MRKFWPIAFLFVLRSICAGDDWETLRTPEPAAKTTLRAVCFPDEKNGWIVGDGGVCLNTSDGGGMWSVQQTGSGAILRDVRFKDALHGWACGDGDPKAPEVKQGHILMGPGIKNLNGTLLTTEDGGKTWKNSWVQTGFELPSIEISTAPVLQVGVGGAHGHIDGDILRSNDGGKQWNGDRSFRGLFDIRSLDDKRWVAVGAPVMVGFTPSPTSPLYTNKNCRALFSKDAGKTWQVAKGSDARSILRCAATKGSGPVLAVGDKGNILRSEDAGENWSAVDSGTKNDLRHVVWSAKTENLAVAVGAAGTILLSSDGGKTWKASTQGGTANFYGVCAAGEKFLAVGEGGVIMRGTVK
jgi:photosystem II stability/assembly factor-like uncharacterized protein